MTFLSELSFSTLLFILNFQIIGENSLWFILLCILLASIYSFFFYYKDRQFFETKKWKMYLLSGFRFVIVFIISFLLISPMLKYLTERLEKPILVFAQDNSESIVSGSDSLFLKNEYSKKLDELFFSKLAEKFEIVKYRFGETIQINDTFHFTEKQTNISEVFEQLTTRYENRNLGAIVLASDGIYNKGKNPVYSTSNLNSSIYTIALGDTATQRDLLITEVKTNKIAFVGNSFPIRVEIKADKLKNTESELKIVNNGKVLFSKPIKIDKNEFSQTIDAEIIAEKKGLQQFNITLTKISTEKIQKNNTSIVVVDVLENKQKILILAHSPHPDLGAIRSALESQQNFEVQIEFASTLKSNVKAYDLIIYHQLPSSEFKIPEILNQTKINLRPTLFILGSQTDILAVNNFFSDQNFKIQQSKKVFEESSALVNENFKIFEISKELKRFIENSDPLLVHFADYTLSGESDILLYQKLKNIPTQKPLIMLSKSDATGSKSAFIMGEGLWRWRLNDYMKNDNHLFFNELISKIVQYLSLKVKKERFIVKTERIFTENQHIKFQAQVYNQSYEAVSGANITMQIKDTANKIYQYTFSQPENAQNPVYNLNAGIFPTGEYTFAAKADIEKESFKINDRFLVTPLDLETNQTVANHKILYQLALNNSGKMFSINELNQLADDLTNNNKIAPIYYSSENLLSFINFKWIFFLVLTLLTLEWFLRKYYGSFM